MILVKPGFSYAVLMWSAALLFALITYQQPGTHLWPGLDQAWAYGLNYAFDKGLVMGRDIYFTFGPLGWLEHTRVVSINMLYLSTAFSFLISLAMNAAVLHLAWQVASQPFLRLLNLVAAVALIVFSFPEMQRLLVLGYALIFLHWLISRQIYLILLSCTVTFCVFIKFSYGASAFSMWFLYLALLYYRDRKTKVVNIALISLVVSYIVIWLMMYGSLSGALGYLEGELHISSGNASAMAMNPENNWWAIGAFYFSIILSAIILQRYGYQYHLLALVFTGPLFVWTKYTFAQEQALHFVPILAFVVYLLAIFIIVVPGWVQKISLVSLMLCACIAWKGMHTPTVGTPDYYNVPHSTLRMPDKGLLKNPRRHVKYLFNVWQTGEKERLQPLRLPKGMREMIGDTTVDIYPWELSIAAANNLNWQPRPAFQTYVAYMPFLDRKNAEFYSSASAPDYIVWHHHEFQDVMNRYSLSSEPMTTESMLRHYKLLHCEGIFCLWKRAEQDQLQAVADIKTETVHWNEWITLPAYDANILRTKLFAKRTLPGRLNLLAWKEGGIEIDYKLENGTIKTHDLLIDNAVSGVWISPYIDQYWGQASAKPEELSRQQLNKILAQAPAQGYIDRIEPTIMGQRLVGWAFMPVDNTQLQQNYILVFNTEKAYLLRADNYNRSDVADYFKSQGKNISSQCGFYEEIANQQLPAGDYKVRFVVKLADEHGSEKWAAIADQGFIFHTDAATRKNKVTAVRFRTTRPWAFMNDMTMKWQGLNFNNSAR
jgi:hypothetical protein